MPHCAARLAAGKLSIVFLSILRCAPATHLA